jgi:cytochrome P450
MRRLLTERHAWEEICGDPSLIPNAIEEVLRFGSSVIAWRRKTTEAVEIGGVPVPADANLLLLLGSANRDPAVFEDPEHFDIHRQNAKEHLSLGFGAHYCLGAPLARLEVRIVLEELSARLPSLHLIPDRRCVSSPTPRSVDRSRSWSSGTPEHDRSPGGEDVKILSVLFPCFTGLDLIGPNDLPEA